jgi:hypothetical protein
MDKKVIQDFLKDMQGVCFKHKMRFDPALKGFRSTVNPNISLAEMIAEAEGCKVSLIDDNDRKLARQPKKVATGKYQ